MAENLNGIVERVTYHNADNGFAVLRVLKKKPFDAAAYEAQRPALLTTLREQKQQRLFEAYLAEARRRHAVERRPDVIRRVLG